ncbi:hypothetical protein [Lonepinella koalarum]|uniref:Uncharacterized protein n=1 Tax=Lonepinella koalarum TaxID=53417 RepID=A0A4R1KPI4_9PAST|nr:hypothetical protein [Lonepinella koalarum]MDH2926616.1 hypothetical protein [Lonepinella koalarum]TCK66936.1 hypothetical protein EV692_2206 [Lonepinella koalarum]TFJ88989.1 hypothetical protein E0709_11150 [Lonepinella koalarum]
MPTKPTLTPKMQAELNALAKYPIDLSDPDAPDDGDWQGAVRGQFKFAQKIHKAHHGEIEAFFDPDVINLIIQHNNSQDRQRANNVLRAVLG